MNYDEFAQLPTEAMVPCKKIIKDDEVWNDEDSKCEKEEMDLIYNCFYLCIIFCLFACNKHMKLIQLNFIYTRFLVGGCVRFRFVFHSGKYRTFALLLFSQRDIELYMSLTLSQCWQNPKCCTE
jgi:hypothetical protein